MKLVRGTRIVPLRLVLYGDSGVGKSTWCAGIPGVVFSAAEDGLDHLDVARIPWPGASPARPMGRPSWRGLFEVLDALRKGAGDLREAKAWVLDTMDAMVDTLTDEVRGQGALEDIGGGFQKGVKRVAELLREFLAAVTALQDARGIHVVFVSHAKRVTQNNPGGASWGRWGLSCEERVAAATVDWTHELAFVQSEIQRPGQGKKGAGLATGRRFLRTDGGPGWIGKSRAGVPDPLPFEPDSFARFWSERAEALSGKVSAELTKAAEEAEARLEPAKRVDAQGRRFLALAIAGGPSRVRRFIGWVEEQVADQEEMTEQPAPALAHDFVAETHSAAAMTPKALMAEGGTGCPPTGGRVIVEHPGVVIPGTSTGQRVVMPDPSPASPPPISSASTGATSSPPPTAPAGHEVPAPAADPTPSRSTETAGTASPAVGSVPETSPAGGQHNQPTGGEAVRRPKKKAASA